MSCWSAMSVWHRWLICLVSGTAVSMLLVVEELLSEKFEEREYIFRLDVLMLTFTVLLLVWMAMEVATAKNWLPQTCSDWVDLLRSQFQGILVTLWAVCSCLFICAETLRSYQSLYLMLFRFHSYILMAQTAVMMIAQFLFANSTNGDRFKLFAKYCVRKRGAHLKALKSRIHALRNTRAGWLLLYNDLYGSYLNLQENQRESLLPIFALYAMDELTWELRHFDWQAGLPCKRCSEPLLPSQAVVASPSTPSFVHAECLFSCLFQEHTLRTVYMRQGAQEPLYEIIMRILAWKDKPDSQWKYGRLGIFGRHPAYFWCSPQAAFSLNN